LDVFEYELYNEMALYGSIPFMISHNAKRTSGIFLFNSAEMWVDVETDGKSTQTHWIAESGILDVFFLLGPKPTQVFKQYASLTGTTDLPPIFSIAYHQCKWNYKSTAEVSEVDDGFDNADIPYDVIWLDIEHTDSKKYFTWDKNHFKDPVSMQNKLQDKGRKLVTIVDPHIKRDGGYPVHTEAQSAGVYIKDKEGKEYEGHCWPGSSSWVDYVNPVARDWWANRFSYDNYVGSTPILHTWNDMNEPSVFSGPEVTMHKDALHLEGTLEHREIHNAYGYYLHMATYQGLVKRNKGQNLRPFVLSRAFFAGSQRYGAIWTGDNNAAWDHLEVAQPMLLSLGVAGITFAGADVGGFFGNADTELLVRWYQAAAFYPFFREHAHLDSKRREPFLFSEPHQSLMRTAIRSRYALLPYFYTLFHTNYVSGVPVLRPMWSEFPEDERTFAEESQFMVGPGLLVRPIVKPGQNSGEVYLPGPESWYDVFNWEKYAPGSHVIQTGLERIPVFQRSGTIIPKKERARRSSTQMANDPYTLVIVLDSKGKANGDLYVDDGVSFDHKNGAYMTNDLSFENGVLSSKVSGSFPAKNTVERIVVVGLQKQVKKVVLKVENEAEKELEFSYQGNRLIVRKPEVEITKNYSVHF